jgi:D-amino-acid dehydrogenase
MSKIAVIGAGITGVTTAYSLLEAGFKVVVIDRNRYAAMDTSFANGGQLSASNAEVWNSLPTLKKAIRWVFSPEAPLLFNPAFSVHKYSWLAEFVWNIRHSRKNTSATVRLALQARQRMFAIAEKERISFDLKRRGILHIYHDQAAYDAAIAANRLLVAAGLERHPVSSAEITSIEPTLTGKYYGGLYTPQDASGDIHKFTRELAKACERMGCEFLTETEVSGFEFTKEKIGIICRRTGETSASEFSPTSAKIAVDRVVICAGVDSYRLSSLLGDRINVYPVKGYSITVHLDNAISREAAPEVSLLDEAAKIVASRLGDDRFRIAGTAELNGYNRDIRDDRIRPLQQWVRAHFPRIDTERVVPWAGLRPMMPDMMPVVRAGTRPGVFYNTGHGHLGWTLSAATADLVTGIIGNSMTP